MNNRIGFGWDIEVNWTGAEVCHRTSGIGSVVNVSDAYRANGIPIATIKEIILIMFFISVSNKNT